MTYEFDSDLLVIEKVRSFEDNAKRPFTNFFAHSIMNADDVGR